MYSFELEFKSVTSRLELFLNAIFPEYGLQILFATSFFEMTADKKFAQIFLKL